jgi:hypothetical protein
MIESKENKAISGAISVNVCVRIAGVLFLKISE